MVFVLPPFRCCQPMVIVCRFGFSAGKKEGEKITDVISQQEDKRCLENKCYTCSVVPFFFRITAVFPLRFAGRTLGCPCHEQSSTLGSLRRIIVDCVCISSITGCRSPSKKYFPRKTLLLVRDEPSKSFLILFLQCKIAPQTDGVVLAPTPTTPAVPAAATLVTPTAPVPASDVGVLCFVCKSVIFCLYR